MTLEAKQDEIAHVTSVLNYGPLLGVNINVE
jgi:hypothetical protein